jgi:hypothetical protein
MINAPGNYKINRQARLYPIGCPKLSYSYLAPAHMVKAIDMIDTTLTGEPTTIYRTQGLGKIDKGG